MMMAHEDLDVHICVWRIYYKLQHSYGSILHHTAVIYAA